MKKRRFIQCDVFTSHPMYGNALAVVLDGEGLDDTQMAAFAAWTNLAETTFLVPPTDEQADYRLRIFTPKREMLFAGHPTLGSCEAWLHTGGVPKEPGVVRQECGVGIVEILIEGQVPAFIAPPTEIDIMPPDTRKDLATIMGLNESTVSASAILSNGPVWQVFELNSAADVLAVDSSTVKWPNQKSIGLIGAADDGSDYDYEVRMLAPSSGMSEDPITGSLNAALAHWFAASGKLDRSLLIHQGTVINRKGRVYISRNPTQPQQIQIGGHTHVLVEGSVCL